MLRLRNRRLGLRPSLNGSTLTLLLVLASGSRAAIAADTPHAPSRLVPAAGLVSFLEYEGLGAQAGAWKATAAYGMLHETTAGAVITGVAERALDRLFSNVPGHALTGSDLVFLHEHVAHHGFTVARYDEAGARATVMIFNELGNKEVRARFDRLLSFLLVGGAGARLPDPREFRGRALYEVGLGANEQPEPDEKAEAVDPGAVGLVAVAANAPTTPTSWWWERNALILVRGPAVELFEDPDSVKEARAAQRARVAAVLDAMESKRPDATTHPAWQAALAEGRDISGFRPNGLFFAESGKGKGVLAVLRDTMESPLDRASGRANEFDEFDALGLSDSERIVARWGFRGRALVTDVRFAASGPWKGLLGMLRPSGFSKGELAIPPGMGALAAGSFGGGNLDEVMNPLRKGMDPDALKALEAVEQMLREESFRQAASEVLRKLGPTWCVYASPGGNGSRTDSTVPTVVVGIDDADAVDRAFGELMMRFNTYLREQENGGNDGQQPKDRPAALVLERLPAPDRGYRLTSPAQAIGWLVNVQPTVVLGKTHLAIAANLSLGRAAIAAESRPAERWAPTGELATALESLPANPAFLIIGNPRDSAWPDAVANLPRRGVAFLQRFVGAPADDEGQRERPARLLGLLGVARNRARALPEAPTAEALAAFLFPSVTAATLDENGCRLIRVEALPFACVGAEARYAPGSGPRPMSISIKFLSGK